MHVDAPPPIPSMHAVNLVRHHCPPRTAVLFQCSLKPETDLSIKGGVEQKWAGAREELMPTTPPFGSLCRGKEAPSVVLAGSSSPPPGSPTFGGELSQPASIHKKRGGGVSSTSATPLLARAFANKYKCL